MRGCPGRVLPTRMHLIAWDVARRTVAETAEVEDAYARREHVWVPVQRRAIVVRGEQRRQLGFELLDHRVF